MLVISKELDANKRNNYQHSERLTFYASLVVSSNKKVIYSERPPGFGKTWENILICVYFNRHLEMKPFYCTISSGLQKQVEDKVASLGNDEFKVVLPRQLNEYLLKGKVIVVFDEYYNELRNSALYYDVRGNLPAVFHAGDDSSNARLVISTGHFSKQFKEFLL